MEMVYIYQLAENQDHLVNIPICRVQTQWCELFSSTLKFSLKYSVGAKNDQQVNIYSFAVRYDRMWPITQ